MILEESVAVKPRSSPSVPVQGRQPARAEQVTVPACHGFVVLSVDPVQGAVDDRKLQAGVFECWKRRVSPALALLAATAIYLPREQVLAGMRARFGTS